MRVRIPLTVAGLPELAAFSESERAALLRHAGDPGPIRLWIRNLSIGTLVSIMVFAVAHWTDLLPPTGAIGILFVLITVGLSTWVVHAIRMIQIRGRLRMAMARASVGELVPICLACGHDCRGIDSDRCSECGAPRLVPRTQGSPS